MRAFVLAVAASALLAPVTVWAQQSTAKSVARPLLIEDFEDGVGRWMTNDDEAATTGGARKCFIESLSGGAPRGGRKSARLEFRASQSGWASVSLPVTGRDWPSKGWRLSLWVHGDGSGEQVRVQLRVQSAEPRRDESYWQTIRLDGTQWERYILRSFGFKNAAGQSLPLADTANIRLLQFTTAGAWRTFRFRVDEIQVEPDAAEPPRTSGGIAAGAAPVKMHDLRLDFGEAGAPSLAQLGFNLGRPPTLLDRTDTEATSWAEAVVSDLAPCVVRLQLSDYYLSDTGTYNLTLLGQHMRWAESLNCRPMICAHPPHKPGLAEPSKAKLYASFVDAVLSLAESSAKSGATVYFELFDEPLSSGTFTDMGHLITAYDKLCALIVRANPRAQVGGPGLAAAWKSQVEGFLRRAARVDFFSFHFHGAHSVLATSEALFRAAWETKSSDLADQMSFSEVRAAAKRLRKQMTPLFVTEFELNSARDRTGFSADERGITAFGGAWIAATVMAGATSVDKLLHARLAGGGSGLLSDSGSPEASYWAAWLMRNYAPRGSVRQWVGRLDDFTVVGLFKTRTARNVIIAYGGAEKVGFRVRPSNLPPLRQVRERHVANLDQQWSGRTLPTVANQQVVMEGPGVYVLQYVLK